MENRIFQLGILVIVLVFGMTVVGCGGNGTPDGYFSVTITDLPAGTGNVRISVSGVKDTNKNTGSWSTTPNGVAKSNGSATVKYDDPVIGYVQVEEPYPAPLITKYSKLHYNHKNNITISYEDDMLEYDDWIALP